MKIHYMTWLRNRIGCATEEVTLPENVRTLSDLLTHLESKGENYKRSLEDRSLIYSSKNSMLCEHSEEIFEHDEIVLFSPIVGG